MPFRKTYILMIALLLSYSGDSWAQELSEAYVPVRSIGMGNAFTAIANDENAIWSNPAGISRVRKARSRKGVHVATFPNLIVGANNEGRSFYSDFKKAQGAATGTTDDGAVEDSVSQVVANSADLGDKPFWARAAMNPLIMFEMGKNNPTAFGLFTNTTTKVFVESDEPESARVEVIADAGVNIGLATSNRTNRFNVGFQLRPAYRYAFDDKIPVANLVDKDAFKSTVENGSNKTTGIGMDVGAMYTLADFWFPTIGIALRNIPTGCKEDYLNPFEEIRQTVCGTTYSGTINNTEALSLVDPTDLRVGMSISPRLSRGMGLRFSMDMHHLHFASGDNNYGLSGVEPLKQVHGGVELFFGNPLLINPLSFRIGFNQGFITMGASIKASFFSLEFASYGQDISSSSTPREDRRSLLSFSFDI